MKVEIPLIQRPQNYFSKLCYSTLIQKRNLWSLPPAVNSNHPNPLTFIPVLNRRTSRRSLRPSKNDTDFPAAINFLSLIPRMFLPPLLLFFLDFLISYRTVVIMCIDVFRIRYHVSSHSFYLELFGFSD
jgi:hypothetical protein